MPNHHENLQALLSSRLPQEVARFLRGLGGLPGGILVAVSGGPDSVALLRAILQCRADWIAGPIVIAHLNHLLRGEESLTDEDFVRDLYLSLRITHGDSLKLACDRADIKARATKQKDNLENAARKYRYSWLGRTARAYGISWIATGHTAEDQAETVLHRLLRGSGIKGLRGIAERRTLGPGLFVIRPLLRVSKQEVLQFLESEGQSYRLDSTNLDLRYTRNRIRHELLPFLAKNYTPDIVLKLCRLAKQARNTYRKVEERAGALLVKMELPRAGTVLVFDRETIAVAPRNLVREAFRLVWERENWPTHAMTFKHWDRLAAMARGELLAVDFPGGIRGRCHGRVVQLGYLP